MELSKTEFDLLELLAFNAGEVIELATDRRGDEPVTRVAMAPLLERVAARSSQRPGRPVQVRSDDTVVMGRELALERVVGNLIENAVKFDDGPGPIDVVCTVGQVRASSRDSNRSG